MEHQAFVQAYKSGQLNFYMSQKTAAEYLSRRLLLPLFMLPVLGTGVALVLIGWYITGVIVFLLGYIAPRLIKKNAPSLLLYQALNDPHTYEELRSEGVLEIED